MGSNDTSSGNGAYVWFLANHNKGRSAAELDEALHELVSAVMETGKPGKLTYTISIKPDGNLETMVVVTDEIKSTLPKFNRRGDMWFATEGGELLREHPTQTGLFDREGMEL